MIRMSVGAAGNLETWLWNVKTDIIRYHSSQRALAAYLGIDPANLARILSGKTMPSLSFYFMVNEFVDYLKNEKACID